MATKITVALEDDLEGGPADETMRFAIGGTAYEIDLNKKNARAFRKQLAPFVEHARKAGRARPAHVVNPAAQRRHPGVGQRPGHRGQRPRAHPGQCGSAVRGRGRSVLTEGLPTTVRRQGTTYGLADERATARCSACNCTTDAQSGTYCYGGCAARRGSIPLSGPTEKAEVQRSPRPAPLLSRQAL